MVFGGLAAAASAVSVLALTRAWPVAHATDGPAVEMWKNRGCACCTGWARHLEAAGFRVTAHDVADVAPVRAAAGVPEDLAGCHTAKVDGYVVEGHVPAEAVRRLLAERPAGVLGIATPGMPLGSPGMEVPGEKGEAYDVIAYAADGSRSVFERVRP